MDWLFADPPEGHYPDDAGTYYEPIHCYCGRFAKYLRTRHYYNGTWDQVTMYVLCSRCGEVAIECV